VRHRLAERAEDGADAVSRLLRRDPEVIRDPADELLSRDALRGGLTTTAVFS
jgi:hypothetical protein